MHADFESAFLAVLERHPDLLAEYQKQHQQAQQHWLSLMIKMQAQPETAVQWFASYLKDAGTGRTPLVGI